MLNKEEIAGIIPHRDPILLLDTIVEMSGESLSAEYTIDSSSPLFEQIFQGHYPGNPITPGVILCEIVFQAGAVLMGQRIKEEMNELVGSPVVTRIRDARFKTMVRPGDKLDISVEFEDQVSSAYYLKGSIKVGGKLAVRVAFTCALVKE